MFENDIKALEDIKKMHKWNTAGDIALLKAVKALRVINHLKDDINALRGGCGLMNDAFDKAVELIEERIEDINDGCIY